jgi:uncharacterized protein (DUF2249 family)
MSDLLLASSQADADAVGAVEQHHAALADALDRHTTALLTVGADVPAVRDVLVAWCERELLPHAAAEEQSLYPAGRATEAGRLLVDAMLGEHQVLLGLVRELAGAGDTAHVAASAGALRAVFSSHLTKENELLLPLLAAAPDVSVAGLLAGMHDLLGEGAEHDTHEDGADGCGGTCGCGETDRPGLPELDVRSVPHAIRHATVFGALESLAPGAGIELVAGHDPLPLLGQVSQRWPGTFAVDYLQRGPEAWRLSLVRSVG